MLNKRKLAQWMIRRRWWIIGITFTLTLLSLISLKNLKINPDVFDNLPKDDPVAALFRRVGDEFGGNYICMIALETDNIYKPEIFRYLKTITDSVSGVAGVGSITSLINIIDIRGSQWGIEIGRLVDEYNLPKGKEELDSLRAYIESKHLYKGSIVSTDGTITVVSVRIQEGVNKIKVAREIRGKIENLHLPVNLYYGGTPFIIEAFGNSIQRDLSFIGPLSLIVILCVLFFGFRDLRGVLLPVLSILISILWTFGLMSLLRCEITIITSIIPILLVAIGGAYTIHVINRIFETHASGLEESIRQGWEQIMPPVFYASITDMFGFISFIFGSYLFLIRIFGIFTAIGILIALTLSLTLIPALMSFGKKKWVDVTERKNHNQQLKWWLARIAQTTTRNPIVILVVWILAVLFIFSGVFRIERKVDFLDYLSPKDPNRISEKVLKEKLGGSNPVYISIKGNILSTAGLKLVDSIETLVKNNPSINHTLSVAQLFKQMNEVMGEGERVPDSQEKIDNLWFMIEGQEILEQLINKTGDEVIIQAIFKSVDIDECKEFDKETTAIANSLGNGYTMQVSGTPSLVVRLDESLIKSQFRSLTIAVILVWIAVTLMLRSVKKSTIAMVPILSTVLILFGFMGWAGIPLDIATVLVGSISIGIGIDYSIYFINSFYIAKNRGLSNQEALYETLSIAGKSISINVLSVTCGFLVLLMSQMIPLARFGLLVGMTMVTSGLGAMTLLPALLMLKEERKNKT